MSVRVLLVDAHEEGRRSLARRLESDGRVAVTAHVPTVADAGAVLRDGQCDVALMNIQSHDDESIARCRELRTLTDIPLVVLTSFMTVEDWQALRQAGAVAYLLKQGNSRLLCSAIVQLARKYQSITTAAQEAATNATSVDRVDRQKRPLGDSEEHESLLSAMRQLEGALESLRLSPEKGWRERAGSELRTVAVSIDRHCQSAEAADGLLTLTERDAGRSRTVSAAHMAHEELCQQVHALLTLLSQDIGINVVRERAIEISNVLRGHLDTVGDLVYDAALEPETGVGD